MNNLTEEIKKEIEEMVYEFFADNCEVEINRITESTSVLDELDGDSLMYLELVELLKKKYGLKIQMQTLGKYLLKHPATTIGEVINTSYQIYMKEDKIVEE